MKIIGIRNGHDASAALVIDGKIVADVSEERFSRIKNDTSFPIKAVSYCLKTAGISPEELDYVAIPSKGIHPLFFIFFDIPDSLLNGNMKKVKRNLSSYPALPVLPLYQKQLKLSESCKIVLCEHHLAHAASAYYTSGLNDEKTLIATMDGSGDEVSVALWRGEKGRIEPLVKYDRNASLGYFYSNATEALHWRHGSDEWKLMGLAPYGKRSPGALAGFHPEFKDGKLVKPRMYGGFGRWNENGANHYHGKDSLLLEEYVDKLGREDFSAEVQGVAEEQGFNIILPWLEKENTRHLCCAGGFFLNVKFNQKLWYTGKIDTQWVYPNPGDSGLSVGAALHVYYTQNEGKEFGLLDNLYQGPEFSNEEIGKILDDRGIAYTYSDTPEKETAKYLADNLIIGWFQGRMEAGPRALGSRSILMSPLRAENKDIINAKVKYREKFRPFCPSVLYENRDDYFVSARDEHFMITSFEVVEEKKARIPAVVHVDGTARPQMVKKEVNERYHNLIKAFGEITGENIILNTSFNIKGEPIICHPREAIRCFYDTGLDVLVLGNYIIEKPGLTRK